MGSAPPEVGLRHDALFYDDNDELVEAAVPFARSGIERGEIVMVNTGQNPVTQLLKALFADEPTVQFADSAFYCKPVSVIDCYKRTMDLARASGVPGYRAIGFIDQERQTLPWREWLRYEAVINRVFADYPFQTLCAYDLRAVPPDIVTAVRSAHPTLVEAGRRVPNEDYLEADELVRRAEYAPKPDAMQSESPHVELEGVCDGTALRIDLYPPMLSTALPRNTVDDFMKAVGEVVNNACRHGRRPVRLRLWAGTHKLICSVIDQGSGMTDPLKGYARSIGSATTRSVSTRDGLGLWAARQLCDVLDYERTEEGFMVRLVVADRQAVRSN